MIVEKLKIWDNFDSDCKTDATLTTYVPENSPEIDLNRRNKTVLVCPGGGYGFTSDREAEPVALAFAAEGLSTFVLRYSVAPDYKYPSALLDAARAMMLIRQNADKWLVDVDNIAIIGFSAGSHLVASLGVFWKKEFISEKLGAASETFKPNKLILSYPVITSKLGECHRGSFENLLGQGLSEEEYATMALENFVSKDTPATFIWHTANDGAVPVESSLYFAQALSKNKIPFELHIYPDGVHGLSLCDERCAAPDATQLVNPYVARWFENAVKWLKTY